MQHHITVKWDTQVMVRKKRAEGNSYVVCAKDGNTYIRGRRLLKPINLPQFTIASSESTATDPQTSDNTRKKPSSKKKNNTDKKKMPRRSPRNHNSSKAADTEIAARLTTFQIYVFQDGEPEVKTEEGCRGCLLYTSPSPRD